MSAQRKLSILKLHPAMPRRGPVAPAILLAWRAGEDTYCPQCGRQHWHVGRVTAECGFCGMALSIIHDGRRV
ncbi:MAG: hypothetical protein ACK5NN_00320 [Sphingomonadaceae bacterium]